MAAHALRFSPAAPQLKLVVLRPAAVWPAPPPLVVVEPAMSATMKRCLLLALLLHVWLVLMLGNAPGGTAAPGQGVAGTLNITLQGLEAPGATEIGVPPLPAAPEGAPGRATLPRWGGVVREQEVALPATPGAAQLGRWSAAPQPADAPEVPPPPPGRVMDEGAQPAPTAVLQTPPVPRTAAPPLLPALAPEAAAPALLPSAAALPLPQTLTPRLQASARPAAAELPVLEPAAPATPVVAPLPPLPAPVALPQLAPLPPASATPAAPVAALPEAPPELPALPAPPVPPMPRAPAVTAPPALQPLASTLEPTSLPSTVIAPGATPAAAATPSLPPAAFAPGAPDAGSRLGSDVATPPSAAASAPPRLNLQLARPRGGELSRGSSGGVLPLLPRPPEVDEKLGRDIARSAKQDCKDAYRGAGLLAVLPLAAQALKADSGCKW